jgi:hypothetical protein
VDIWDAVVKTVKVRRELILHALLESGCARSASQITFILSFQATAAHTEFSKNKKSKVASLCTQILRDSTYRVTAVVYVP